MVPRPHADVFLNRHLTYVHRVGVLLHAYRAAGKSARRMWHLLREGKSNDVNFIVDHYHSMMMVIRNCNKYLSTENDAHLRRVIIAMHRSIMYLGHPLVDDPPYGKLTTVQVVVCVRS